MEEVDQNHRRRVLLEIETAIAPGRDMLRGISKFVGEIHRWDVYHNAGHWSLHGGVSGPSHIEPLSGDRKIDGVITRIYDEVTRMRAHDLIARGIPVVDILGDHGDRSLPLVHTNDAAIANSAFKHFTGQGFKRFAFCGIENTRWSVLRGKHFCKEAAKLCGKTPAFTVSKMQQSHGEIDAKRVEDWLRTLTLPIGIFVSCDHIAPLVVEAATRIGITIPENMALVGVNNDTVACSVCNPTLSSIDASHFEIGYRAAQLLNILLEGGKPPVEPILISPSRLIVRDSSGKSAINDPLIAKAARFINRNAGSPIGVDEVVATVPLSRRELQRRFRLITGETIHSAITEARIQIAKRLLDNPEYSIDRVARLSGFGSRQHFAKIFKTQTGLTPANYRKERSLK
jgi:LacI family transcriptional regulator